MARGTTSLTLILRSSSALIFHAFLLGNLRVRTARAVKSSCNTTVICGAAATVSCYFDGDLNGLQRDLQVIRQNTDGKEIVLVYAWFDGKPEFHLSPMYEFDGKITDHLHIQIPHVQTSNTGLYTCLVGQSDAEHSTSCLLNVTNCEQSTLNGSNIQNHRQSSSLEKNADVAQNYDYVVPIVLGATSILLATLVVIVVVCIRKKVFYRCMKKTESDPENVEEDKAARKPLNDNAGREHYAKYHSPKDVIKIAI